MPDEADRREEAYWIARLRAKGYTVQAGPDTGGIPFEPEVAFTRPTGDRDCLKAREGQSVAETEMPCVCRASTVKQGSEHNDDDPAVPDWVRRMRADGYTVRIGTDPTPLPFEPQVDFTLPGDRDHVEALEGQAVAEPVPPVTSPASTLKKMPDEANRSVEPYWVAGLRAKAIPYASERVQAGFHSSPRLLSLLLVGFPKASADG
ncbi:MAG TPA: hypothetical protein VFS20_28170 [Longimicrobium sp.]|nr:hypothetical protein [Longimicrobium sp.]